MDRETCVPCISGANHSLRGIKANDPALREGRELSREAACSAAEIEDIVVRLNIQKADQFFCGGFLDQRIFLIPRCNFGKSCESQGLLPSGRLTRPCPSITSTTPTRMIDIPKIVVMVISSPASQTPSSTANAGFT
jgi:hypothetical protein